MNNPEIEAVDILLQERTPEKAIITKEKKEKIEKVKIKDYQNYMETSYTKIEDKFIDTYLTKDIHGMQKELL